MNWIIDHVNGFFGLHIGHVAWYWQVLIGIAVFLFLRYIFNQITNVFLLNVGVDPKEPVTPENAALIYKGIEKIFSRPTPTLTSLVCEDGVTVSYSIEDHHEQGYQLTDFMDKKIKEMIQNNRETDFYLHADALHISIISYERGATLKQPEKKSLPTEDVEIGDWSA